MEVIENLVKNYEENVNLKVTLIEILRRLETEYDPYVRKNLNSWKNKYMRRINQMENPDITNSLNDRWKVTEEFVENYIFTTGLFLKDIIITKFLRQKNIGIGVVDLLGITETEEVVIEIKGVPAKSSAIGQVLAYWQYFKEIENKNNKILVIAPSFTEQYFYTHRAVSEIRILNIKYKITNNGIEFKNLTK